MGWAPGAGAQSIALQCQLDGGAWQACLMQVQDIGRAWRIEMGRGRPWRLVQTRWIAVPASAQSALCWNGLCALGAVPLD